MPRHVAVLGLGPSVGTYLNIVKRLGGRRALADEVWGINAIGDVIACDRIFHMDDVRIQQIRAEARPDSNIAVMLRWLKTTTVPVYTSRPHPDYPALIPFPLADVVASTGYAYFNSTAAYPIALAIHLGVHKLTIFGNDFTYANAHHAEKGRACVEFWLGYAAACGLELSLPGTTSLMDACETDRRPYGYDTLEVAFGRDDSGALQTTFTERDGPLPTADEIEHRYDHSRHPSPLVEREQQQQEA